VAKPVLQSSNLVKPVLQSNNLAELVQRTDNVDVVLLLWPNNVAGLVP
jgi:hypothetical protein